MGNVNDKKFELDKLKIGNLFKYDLEYDIFSGIKNVLGVVVNNEYFYSIFDDCYFMYFINNDHSKLRDDHIYVRGYGDFIKTYFCKGYNNYNEIKKFLEDGRMSYEEIRNLVVNSLCCTFSYNGSWITYDDSPVSLLHDNLDSIGEQNLIIKPSQLVKIKK
jgi:hypothetical protein